MPTCLVPSWISGAVARGCGRARRSSIGSSTAENGRYSTRSPVRVPQRWAHAGLDMFDGGIDMRVRNEVCSAVEALVSRPVMLEILRATRTADYDDVAESLSAHPVVRVHDGTYLRALEIQHQLAIRSQHRGISTTGRAGRRRNRGSRRDRRSLRRRLRRDHRSDRSDHPVDRAGRHRRLTSPPCSTNSAPTVGRVRQGVSSTLTRCRGPPSRSA